MLPQTNLQLYRLMIDTGASDTDLKRVYTAYHISKQLFGNCFRPDDKPFVCHLIGTAAALVMWKKTVSVVIAGLLHSAYLYGQFDDGDRGPSLRRRKWLSDHIGSKAEAIIWCYTTLRWNHSAVELQELAKDDAEFRALATIKLADTLDELTDGGADYTLGKTLPFGLKDGETGIAQLIVVVESIVSLDAANQFQSTCLENQSVEIPVYLKTSAHSFHAVRTGIDRLRRGKVQQRLRKIIHKIPKVA